MTETLEALLGKFALQANDTRFRRLQESHYSERQDIDVELRNIPIYNEEILNFVTFIQNCQLKVGKTKVQRVKGEWSKKTFKHRNRFVVPTVILVYKSKKILVRSGVMKNPHRKDPIQRDPFIKCKKCPDYFLVSPDKNCTDCHAKCGSGLHRYNSNFWLACPTCFNEIERVHES